MHNPSFVWAGQFQKSNVIKIVEEQSQGNVDKKVWFLISVLRLRVRADNFGSQTLGVF